MKTQEVARTSAILGNDVIYQEFVEARFLKFRPKFSTDFAILHQENTKIHEMARISPVFGTFLGLDNEKGN